MAAPSSRFGFSIVEFDSVTSSGGVYSLVADLRRAKNLNIVFGGTACGSRTVSQRFISRSELSSEREIIGDILVAKEVEGASSSDGVSMNCAPNVAENGLKALVDSGNGGGSFGGQDGNGGRRGDGDHESGGEFEKGDGEAAEFGPLLKFDEVMREVRARGASLPADMLEAAKTTGIRSIILSRYLDLQASIWPLSAAIRSCGMLRNRMLADPAFLFKISTEIVIDSCCATFAEVQKRGEGFWQEFELYLADLIVGTVVNVALVGMLAPYVRFGQPSMSTGLLARTIRAYGALPSSVFEAERPGCRFSIQQRLGTYFFKGVVYGSVGFACGLIGQGIANLIMTAKRQVRSSQHDVPVPPLVKSAALWGVFLAVSSNTRYQIINGLERVVEASPLARQVSPVALAFTVGIRFANNVYGGMQFVDWARWSGCQ